MADPEQLTIIRQGTDIWNEWRKQNPNIKINLSYTNLRGANLTEANLTKADLRGANFSYANLTKACLLEAKL